MKILLIIIIITEVLTLVVLRQHYLNVSRPKYIISVTIHFLLSLWLWILCLEIISYNGFYDDPRHIWLLMNMKGMTVAVVVPRLILCILHFSGKIKSSKKGTHNRVLTNTGLSIMLVIFLIVASGTLHGRFNFKTEKVTIKIKDLNEELEGLKIVQLSDIHLSCFYKHGKLLSEVMDSINKINPDLILNTGDFINYGWREFGNNDTILAKAKSTYGNFAIIGNHDFGLYHPFFTEADIDNNNLMMNKLIKSSGYTVLNNEFSIVKVKNAEIAVIGITTRGRHPNVIHGNLTKAISGLDSADFKILLSHDPNQWAEEVPGKTDIDLTLSGHTHGMQMGIITENFKWSPSKYFYPHWHGLFSEGNQFHYVNRGLGVLAIPFRIWMPPEITLITLQKE